MSPSDPWFAYGPDFAVLPHIGWVPYLPHCVLIRLVVHSIVFLPLHHCLERATRASLRPMPPLAMMVPNDTQKAVGPIRYWRSRKNSLRSTATYRDVEEGIEPDEPCAKEQDKR